MLLDSEERKRFADYLRADCESNELLIEQLQKLGGPKELIALKMEQANACRVVAEMLDNTSDM